MILPALPAGCYSAAKRNSNFLIGRVVGNLETIQKRASGKRKRRPAPHMLIFSISSSGAL
jgi:hypothetical protein